MYNLQITWCLQLQNYSLKFFLYSIDSQFVLKICNDRDIGHYLPAGYLQNKQVYTY